MELYERIIVDNPGSSDALEAEANLQDLFERYAQSWVESEPQKAAKLYRGIIPRWPILDKPSKHGRG